MGDGSEGDDDELRERVNEGDFADPALGSDESGHELIVQSVIAPMAGVIERFAGGFEQVEPDADDDKEGVQS